MNSDESKNLNNVENSNDLGCDERDAVKIEFGQEQQGARQRGSNDSDNLKNIENSNDLGGYESDGVKIEFGQQQQARCKAMRE